eukprot:1094398-Amphidinium_carterae.1
MSKHHFGCIAAWSASTATMVQSSLPSWAKPEPWAGMMPCREDCWVLGFHGLGRYGEAKQAGVLGHTCALLKLCPCATTVSGYIIPNPSTKLARIIIPYISITIAACNLIVFMYGET